MNTRETWWSLVTETGRLVGAVLAHGVDRVREFPKLRTRPYKSRLDALDEIIRLTSEEIRELYERMGVK